MTQSADAIDAHVIVEKRMHKRNPVLYHAVGLMPRDDTFKCRVLNISDGGAMLQIDDVDVLPEKLRVFIPESKTMHDCEVVWKKDGNLGVRFVSSTQYN